MSRIVIAGFHHETNTFAPVKAGFEEFELADDWPGLSQGEDVFSAVADVRIPISGAIDVLNTRHELIPLLWCSATPSAHVTEHAFETISTMMTDRLNLIDGIDGIYLDLHGAMVCEHLDDGEGELIRRIREIAGPNIPIAVSLDLHANITDKMFRHASVIDCYRTYPHIDMVQTGRRTAKQLEHLINQRTSNYPYRAMRRISFLIPHNWGCTLIEPCLSLYQQVEALAKSRSQVVTFASGFPHADIAEAGPVVLVYGDNEVAVNQTADQLLARVEAARPQFKGNIYSPKKAIELTKLHVKNKQTPVVIADTQDNPGGGGPGDTVGLLREFVHAKLKNVVVATIFDPHVAKLAHAVGVGQTIQAALGEGSNMPGHHAMQGSYKVLELGDGNFTATGPMYGGSHMQLGLMAKLEIEGVQVLVASKAVQVADQSIFRHLGVEPADQAIISVKSSVHFRNDFQALAGAIMLVAAPGPVAADLSQLEYQNVPQSMTL